MRVWEIYCDSYNVPMKAYETNNRGILFWFMLYVSFVVMGFLFLQGELDSGKVLDGFGNSSYRSIIHLIILPIVFSLHYFLYTLIYKLVVNKLSKGITIKYSSLVQSTLPSINVLILFLIPILISTNFWLTDFYRGKYDILEWMFYFVLPFCLVFNSFQKGIKQLVGDEHGTGLSTAYGVFYFFSLLLFRDMVIKGITIIMG